jgi:hypothetical protein
MEDFPAKCRTDSRGFVELALQASPKHPFPNPRSLTRFQAPKGVPAEAVGKSRQPSCVFQKKTNHGLTSPNPQRINRNPLDPN